MIDENVPPDAPPPDPPPPLGSGEPEPPPKPRMPQTRGPAYQRVDGGIDCEVQLPDGGWAPFTARTDDPVSYGPEIHAYWMAHPAELIQPQEG